MNDSTTNLEPQSRFLGLPLEIRRHIYRFLLLDPHESFLSTPWYQEAYRAEEVNEDCTDGQLWDGIEYQGKFYEHNYNDSGSDMDYPSSDGSSKERGTEATLVGESKVQDEHKSVWKHGVDEEIDVRRYPAILRANRQIYSEASSLLYTELNMHLQPGDVLCMKIGKDIVKASERLWRHNPLQGIGSTNPSGQTVYATPELDGVMEPHVLARFKKITFELDFNWEMETYEGIRSREDAGLEAAWDDTAPSLFVNENLTVNPEDEAKLLAFYRRSTIIHQLVKILSNFPDIIRLDMPLDIEVLAQYDMSWAWESEEEDDDEEADETTRKMSLANERAVDLFLDSGLLTPLEKLSNVRSFRFDFVTMDRNDDFYKPTSKRDRMLSDLKQKIERNYVIRDD